MRKLRAPRDWFRMEDVRDHLRVILTQAQRTAAGQALQRLYTAATTEEPPKYLARKTNGDGGTHTHAFYPPEFWDEAVQIVRRIATTPDPQLPLFE